MLKSFLKTPELFLKRSRVSINIHISILSFVLKREVSRLFMDRRALFKSEVEWIQSFMCIVSLQVSVYLCILCISLSKHCQRYKTNICKSEWAEDR